MAAQACLSLHLSKCHIVVNRMSQLIYVYIINYQSYATTLKLCHLIRNGGILDYLLAKRQCGGYFNCLQQCFGYEIKKSSIFRPSNLIQMYPKLMQSHQVILNRIILEQSYLHFA